MTGGNLLTDRDHARVGKVVARAEQRLFGAAAGEPRPLTDVVMLKVQSGASDSSGYPARVQTNTDPAGPWSDYDATTVRVKDPNGGSFASGDYVLARCVGPNASGVMCFAATRGEAGGGGGCDDCAWLVDRDALKTKAFRVRVRAGVDGGRCECMSEQPVTGGEEEEDEDGNPTWLAVYDASDDNWKLSKTFRTCCGCGLLTLDVTPAGAKPMTGTLKINKACDDDLPYEYSLVFQCCSTIENEDGTTTYRAVFAGGGPDNCDGVAPFACDNSFQVWVDCWDCVLGNPECDECVEMGGPPALFIDVENAFFNNWAVFNGLWHLASSGECTWSTACHDVTVTAEMTRSGSDSVLTVTFTYDDGSGGTLTAIYVYTETGTNLTCFADHTAARDTGDPTDTPASILVEPVYCEVAAGFCTTVWTDPIEVTTSNATGGCECMSLTKFSQTTGPESASWGMSGCVSNTMVTLSCTNGRLSVAVGGGATYTATTVSRSNDPFVYVVDITFTSNPTNPCPDGSVRLTFTHAP